MSTESRRVYAAIAEFLDNLSPDFDFEDSLRAYAADCVSILGTTGAIFAIAGVRQAAGITVAWGDGAAELAAVEAGAGQGPTLECLGTGRAVRCPKVTAARMRWPGWSVAALRGGFLAAHALPLLSGGEVLGAVTLLRDAPGPLPEEVEQLALSFAEVAAAGAKARREELRRAKLVAQLQNGIVSRVAIEQAKGILAERNGQSMDEALTALRDFARRNRRSLHAVAAEVIEGSVGPPLGRPGA